MFRQIALTACLLPALGGAQGSGSKASLSLLELEDPLTACLEAGAELALDPEQGVDLTLEEATPSLIWAVTFDQTLVEVEHEGEFYFAQAEQVLFEECP